jgi:hypothetical protein
MERCTFTSQALDRGHAPGHSRGQDQA